MFRKLVKTVEIEVGAQTYRVHYYEHETARGARRFSSELVLGSGDHIILDDESMCGLESKVARLVPATIYSRELFGRMSAAA